MPTSVLVNLKNSRLFSSVMIGDVVQCVTGSTGLATGPVTYRGCENATTGVVRWPRRNPRGSSTKLFDKAPSLIVAILLTFSAAIAACGGSSPSGQAGASPASSAAPSAAPSATPSATPSAGYAVNLTFTGTLAGTTTKAKAPSGTPACGDFVGHILVGVTLNGHDYDFLLTNVAYKALGKYTVGDASSETQVLFSDGGFGGKTIYSSTSGTVTYISAKSIVVDMETAEQSTGQSAHVSGTASCA
jgi:hypothetical protein